VRAAILAPPVALAGNEMDRPAARHSISMRQPWPMRMVPPMMYSIGMNTSVPVVGPFRNAELSGKWRRPTSTPGVSVGISASVMPRETSAPSRFCGSYSLKASPSSVATGASVM
jgi:hypothetical protein